MRPVPYLALVLALVAVPAAAKDRRPAEVIRGEAVAQRNCASCHAIRPGADSPNPKSPPFASREMQHEAGLEGRIADITREGHYGMPAVTLTAAEIADLQAYIASIGPH